MNESVQTNAKIHPLTQMGMDVEQLYRGGVISVDYDIWWARFGPDGRPIVEEGEILYLGNGGWKSGDSAPAGLYRTELSHVTRWGETAGITTLTLRSLKGNFYPSYELLQEGWQVHGVWYEVETRKKNRPGRDQSPDSGRRIRIKLSE